MPIEFNPFDSFHVGDTASQSKTITEADVVLFSGLTGDFNPIHLDAEYAKKSFFGTRLVQGMFVASLIGAVAAPLCGSASINMGQSFTFPAPARLGDTLTATIEVESGDSVGTVATKLKKAGLINSKLLFMITSPVFHASRYIQPGVYELNTDMDFNCLIKSMQPTGGVAATVTVTIPEGYTVEQIIQLLAENDVSDAAALEESAKNHVFDKFDFVDNENLGSISRLEGYLFPDTYEFYVKENADSALSRLLANFQDRIVDDPVLAPLIANSSYSLKQIVIMASLIEKETDGTDRTLISSVIHNRLENVGETAHLLQIDASLVYAAGREITEDDYQTLDSPYNLYTHQGLPPTAIANAGKASFQAALPPADTNYYFYVLNPDTQRHVFSRTLSEHNANLRKFG